MTLQGLNARDDNGRRVVAHRRVMGCLQSGTDFGMRGADMTTVRLNLCQGPLDAAETRWRTAILERFHLENGAAALVHATFQSR